jgi:DNA-binding transcriptional MerR regulator
MATNASPKRALADQVVIPDRLYFKIGDVAAICGLETYVLRFWESQFPQLKPNKSGTGQRLYRRREVELVLEIKRLVHSEGYTLAGARQALESTTRRRERAQTQTLQPAVEPTPAPAPVQVPRLTRDIAAALQTARAELREIASLLASPDPIPASARRRPRLAPTPSAHETQSLFPS